MNTISIDVRMAFSSGIGTYIRNVIPRIMAQCPDYHFSLLGHLEELKRVAWSPHDNLSLIHCDAPIYSIKEQFELIRKIPKSSLFWSPHYNIPLFYKGKMLVTVHDAFPLVAFSSISQAHKKLYARILFNGIKRKASAVICVSKFTENELRRLVGDQNYSVIYNGVDPSWFEIQDSPSPHSRAYLLFVGNIKPHKNLKNLLTAFKSIMNQSPLDLVIIGQKEGFISGDSEVIAQSQALGDRVHFTGFIEDAKLKQYFKHANALVFPSLYEGFGLPPLEAMACGCPALVSNAASLPEICGNGALYCDPNDPSNIAKHLMTISSDNAVRNELILKGKERATTFRWEVSTTTTLLALNTLLRC